MREAKITKDRKCNTCNKVFAMTAAQIKEHASLCGKEKSIERGIADAKAGRIVDLGSFAEHAKEDNHEEHSDRTIEIARVGQWGS